MRSGRPQGRRAIALKPPKKLPRVVTAAEMQAILDACEHLRDRTLLAVLPDVGVRIGEALGLRHEDIAVAEREITIVPRANGNGARSKGRDPRTIPVRGQLIRLYGDYLATEYCDLDSDYVFVNLFAGPRGQAWTYAAACDLVLRLRERTGLDFDPHWCRHAFPARSLRDGVPVEVVSRLLGHSSITTTLTVDGHLTAEDARHALEAAGCRNLVASIIKDSTSLASSPTSTLWRSTFVSAAWSDLFGAHSVNSTKPECQRAATKVSLS